MKAPSRTKPEKVLPLGRGSKGGEKLGPSRGKVKGRKGCNPDSVEFNYYSRTHSFHKDEKDLEKKKILISILSA